MRVSLPLTAEGGPIRAALAALCAVVALAAVAAVAPPSAHASFTIPACGGSAVQGEGSSLQAVAQEQFWTQNVFYTSFGCGSGAVSSSPVTYTSDGSGCGIASIGGGPGAKAKCASGTPEAQNAKAGERAATSRFAASDAPLTPTQKAAAEAQGGPNPGLIHQIPVAVAAVSVIVHFPEGCSLENPAQAGGNGNTSTGGFPVPEAKAGEVKAGEEDRNNDPANGYTGDKFSEETLRVHIPAAMLERIWDGTPTTWGEVLTSGGKVHIVGATDTSLLNAGIACENVHVRRIVRLDGSGTTYNFKAYLGLLPGAPTGLWTTAPIAGDNNIWPVTTSKNETPEPANKSTNVCEDASLICTAASEKGGPLAKAVAATDGSIGYLDLATARKEKFSVEKGKPNHTYWIPLQTINPAEPEGKRVGTNFVEPTAVPTAHIVNSGAALGANCTNADYRGIPVTPASDPTLGDWSSAIATGSMDTVTYPACALTYDFAFDDDAPVFGNTQIEQERARTVKDYLTAVESPAGQLGLTSADYGTLPMAIQTIGQNGVKAIDWNKAAGSGGGPKTEPKAEPKTEPPGGGGPPIVTPPSNAFSITGAKVKGKAIVLSLVLPGPGKVQIKATGGGVTVASVVAVVKAGNGSVTLSISKAALSKLAKIKSHKFGVKITVTFTPTGGTAAGKTKTITLTKAAVATKKASKGKGKGKK